MDTIRTYFTRSAVSGATHVHVNYTMPNNKTAKCIDNTIKQTYIEHK